MRAKRLCNECINIDPYTLWVLILIIDKLTPSIEAGIIALGLKWITPKKKELIAIANQVLYFCFIIL